MLFFESTKGSQAYKFSGESLVSKLYVLACCYQLTKYYITQTVKA